MMASTPALKGTLNKVFAARFSAKAKDWAMKFIDNNNFKQKLRKHTEFNEPFTKCRV